MEIDELLRRWGGVATRGQLVLSIGRGEVDRALANGSIVRCGHGRYGSARLDTDLSRAHGLSGVLSHESAALLHGWGVLLPPEECHVMVPVKRRIRAVDHRDVVLHRADLHVDEVSGILTSQERTILDCLRMSDLRRSLAVADSALRGGRTPAWLRGIARDARGHGCVQARRVAAEATDLAANPFESGLRAIGLDVPGLALRPQVPIYDAHGGFLGRPDLVDSDLRIIAEADSFEWHGARSALVKDARRYNAFAVAGWLVLRFTWEDVMFQPESVRQILTAAVFERSQTASGHQARRKKGVDSVQIRKLGQKPKVR